MKSFVHVFLFLVIIGSVRHGIINYIFVLYRIFYTHACTVIPLFPLELVMYDFLFLNFGNIGLPLYVNIHTVYNRTQWLFLYKVACTCLICAPTKYDFIFFLPTNIRATFVYSFKEMSGLIIFGSYNMFQLLFCLCLW